MNYDIKNFLDNEIYGIKEKPNEKLDLKTLEELKKIDEELLAYGYFIE